MPRRKSCVAGLNISPNFGAPANVAKVREHAPHFCCDAVINGRFTQRSLNYYLSRDQWLMIFFIPMAFSFVCPTEVLAFDNVLEEFTEQDCSVIFVSTDSKYSLHSWQSRPKNDGGLGDINVPLLSDQNHKMSKAYGVLVEDEGIALRGRFIINPEGVVKHISINDVAVGRSVLESLRLLQAYKAEHEHGVFCAANWKPGDSTLEPTAEAAQEYVNQHFGELNLGDRDTAAPIPKAPTLHREESAKSSKSGKSAAQDEPKSPRSPSAAATPIQHFPDSGQTSPRKFAIEAISKVFGGNHGPSTPPVARAHTPMVQVEEMNALNAANQRNVKEHTHGHRKTISGSSVQSYFDYEPFLPAPKAKEEKKVQYDDIPPK